MKTFTPSASDIERHWYVVDAEDETLGRLASRIARILRGKHKPTWAPHLDMGDHVIVVNADKVRVSGRKVTDKLYQSHSGFPGSVRSVPFLELVETSPTRVIEQAVGGMLPKSKLGRSMIRKLKVYAGPDHPHAAQQPDPLPRR